MNPDPLRAPGTDLDPEARRVLAELVHLASETVPYWRASAIVGLVVVALVGIIVAASFYWPEEWRD